MSKVNIVQGAHDLLQDEVYTKEDVVKTVIDVIHMIKNEKRVRKSACDERLSLYIKGAMKKQEYQLFSKECDRQVKMNKELNRKIRSKSLFY